MKMNNPDSVLVAIQILHTSMIYNFKIIMIGIAMCTIVSLVTIISYLELMFKGR